MMEDFCTNFSMHSFCKIFILNFLRTTSIMYQGKIERSFFQNSFLRYFHVNCTRMGMHFIVYYCVQLILFSFILSKRECKVLESSVYHKNGKLFREETFRNKRALEKNQHKLTLDVKVSSMFRTIHFLEKSYFHFKVSFGFLVGHLMISLIAVGSRDQ